MYPGPINRLHFTGFLSKQIFKVDRSVFLGCGGVWGGFLFSYVTVSFFVFFMSSVTPRSHLSHQSHHASGPPHTSPPPSPQSPPPSPHTHIRHNCPEATLLSVSLIQPPVPFAFQKCSLSCQLKQIMNNFCCQERVFWSCMYLVYMHVFMPVCTSTFNIHIHVRRGKHEGIQTTNISSRVLKAPFNYICEHIWVTMG